MTYHVLTQGAVVIRIFAALLIGGLIGMERGMKNRPAGLRTYMLVCVGSCLIMMTNQYLFQVTGSGDPMRLGAQVVSGIGFLGAGTIVVTRHNQIRGLTTAAGLWSCAGVGLALGVGFYEAAITASIGIYVILKILQGLDNRVHKKIRMIEMYVELCNTVQLSDFLHSLRSLDLIVENIQFEPDGGMEAYSRAVLVSLKTKKSIDHVQIREMVKKIDGVIHLEEL